MNNRINIKDLLYGVLLLILLITLILFPPLSILIWVLYKRCERNSLTNAAIRDIIKEKTLESDYMFSYFDFAPFKLGDCVYNREHEELEIVSFCNEKGILCSDLNWYMSDELHYKIIPEFGKLMTLRELTIMCELGEFIDYDGFCYLAYPDGFVTKVRLYPSEILLNKASNYPELTMAVWYNR